MKYGLNRREILALIGVGLIVFSLPYWISQFETGISFMETGQIGDTIGGITAPILSFVGSILVFLALKAQIEANKQINDQFKEQKIIDYRQNFENTFFNMLSNHHQIIDSIDIETNLLQFSGSLKDYLYQNNQTYSSHLGLVEKSKPLRSRDVFKYSFELLLRLLRDDLIFSEHIPKLPYSIITIINFSKSFYEIEKIKKEKIIYGDIDKDTSFQSIYDIIYFKLNTDFGHYFRNLYRIIKMIDEREFVKNELENFDIQYSYTSIVRSQLSDYELHWLFFNCLSNKGNEKFKPYLEKYSFFKILDEHEDPVFVFYKQFYAKTAFKKPKDLNKHLSLFIN